MRTPHLTLLPDGAPLWKVFWLHGVIPSNLLWAAVLWMMARNVSPSGVGILLLVVLAYTAWIVPSVWMAAPNTPNPRNTVLARALTVAWAINTVLLVFFLEVQLQS